MVGRHNDQSVVTVLKVHQKENIYHTKITNIIVLGIKEEDRHFEVQASEIKKLILAFNPKEVVIDTNGLGVGLLDFMMRPTLDRKTGILYPAYGVFNDPKYERTQPLDAEKIIYSLKANATTTGQIHSNCYTRINSGLVKFLIKETEAKNKIMSTIKGQKMKIEERVARILPHEMTTRLFEEMANLRLKPTGSATEINLEMINKRYHKDKFSSLEYGLWRVKELEEELNKRWRRAGKKRRLMIYTSGGAEW